MSKRGMSRWAMRQMGHKDSPSLTTTIAAWLFVLTIVGLLVGRALGWW